MKRSALFGIAVGIITFFALATCHASNERYELAWNDLGTSTVSTVNVDATDLAWFTVISPEVQTKPHSLKVESLLGPGNFIVSIVDEDEGVEIFHGQGNPVFTYLPMTSNRVYSVIVTRGTTFNTNVKVTIK